MGEDALPLQRSTSIGVVGWKTWRKVKILQGYFQLEQFSLVTARNDV